ncbi:integrase, catalytic region, zinc finger, CCHC-type containing protein, partial [Tanacetum coccineum]
IPICKMRFDDGRGTWYYSLGVFLAIVDAFVRSELKFPHGVVLELMLGRIFWVVRLMVAKDGNYSLIPKLELESFRFTFDLVPLSYESVDVVVGENWLLRHKAEMDDILKPTRKSYGGVRVERLKIDCDVTNGREDVREFSKHRGSGAKRSYLDVMEGYPNGIMEPILALPDRADNFVVTVLWAITGGSELNGSNLVQETTNKIVVIQERLEAAKLSKELAWLSRLFSGTVRFGNDHIARIMGYGDYQMGNITISRVYYVEGLRHNLFSVGQFCNADLEVAFWKNTWFICNLEGVDLHVGSRDINLFLRTKDEALEAIIKCIKNIQVHLNATVRNVRTDNGTKFVNQTLREFYENVGISHQTFVAHTPQQNGVIERRNQTLVEAARTMLIFSKAL